MVSDNIGFREVRQQLVFLIGFLALASSTALYAQADLDSLDSWVRQMQPDPFVRCGETTWIEALDATREHWLGKTYLEKVVLTNKLLQVLQDSHTAVSAYDWIWDVEHAFGTLPIRWYIEGVRCGPLILGFQDSLKVFGC